MPDEVVCLAQPDPFYAIGLHYQRFEQVEDAEVISLLQQPITAYSLATVAGGGVWAHDA
jgi:putative phosphoribosyl transferase